MSFTNDSDKPVARSPVVIVTGSTTSVALTLDDPDWESCFVCHDPADIVSIIVDYYSNPPNPPPSGGGGTGGGGTGGGGTGGGGTGASTINDHDWPGW